MGGAALIAGVVCCTREEVEEEEREKERAAAARRRREEEEAERKKREREEEEEEEKARGERILGIICQGWGQTERRTGSETIKYSDECQQSSPCGKMERYVHTRGNTLHMMISVFYYQAIFGTTINNILSNRACLSCITYAKFGSVFDGDWLLRAQKTLWVCRGSSWR